MSFELQKQIRENANVFSSCVNSLKQWTKDISEEDERLLEQSRTSEPVKRFENGEKVNNTENAEKHKELGNRFFKKSDFGQAIAQYTKGLEFAADHHVLLGNRGMCYLRLQQYEHCVADSSKAIRIKPDYVKPYDRKGKALKALGKFEEALAVYEEGLVHCKTEKQNRMFAVAMDDIAKTLKEMEELMGPYTSLDSNIKKQDLKEKKVVQMKEPEPVAVEEEIPKPKPKKKKRIIIIESDSDSEEEPMIEEAPISAKEEEPAVDEIPEEKEEQNDAEIIALAAKHDIASSAYSFERIYNEIKTSPKALFTYLMRIDPQQISVFIGTISNGVIFGKIINALYLEMTVSNVHDISGIVQSFTTINRLSILRRSLSSDAVSELQQLVAFVEENDAGNMTTVRKKFKMKK
ncbi:hypothetical protein PCE1_003856 [Barthelona sp. PCE]